MDLALYYGINSVVEPQLVDSYETLIWKERYVGQGEFKLTLTEAAAKPFTTTGKQFLTRTDVNSPRMMMVETIQDKPAPQGSGRLFEISGRSVEAFFHKRNNYSPNVSVANIPSLKASGAAYWLAERYLVNPATAISGEVMPNMTISNIVSSTTGTTSERSIERGTIYDGLTALCAEDDLGWSVVKDGTNMRILIYEGVDRSNPANANFYVLSRDSENFNEQSYLESSANEYNHAYVVGKTQAVDVFTGLGASATGFDRKTIGVVETSINSDGSLTATQEQNALKAIGRATLRDPQYRHIRVIDGEVLSANIFRSLGMLGDIVYVRGGSDNLGKPMRISEIIHSVDPTNGYRCVPTLEDL